MLGMVSIIYNSVSCVCSQTERGVIPQLGTPKQEFSLDVGEDAYESNLWAYSPIVFHMCSHSLG